MGESALVGFIYTGSFWSQCHQVEQLLKATDEGKEVSYATSFEELERELWARHPLIDEQYGVYHGGTSVYDEPVFRFKSNASELDLGILGRVVRRQGSVKVAGVNVDRDALMKLPDVVVSDSDRYQWGITYDPKKRAELDKRRAQRAAAQKAEAVVRMTDLRDALGALDALTAKAEGPARRRLEFVQCGRTNCGVCSTESVVKTFLQVFEAVLDVVPLKELQVTSEMRRLAGLWRERRAASVAKYSPMANGEDLVRLLDRLAGVRARKAG